MLTAEMFTPIVTSITENIAVAVPAGLGIFAIIAALNIGIRVFKGFCR